VRILSTERSTGSIDGIQLSRFEVGHRYLARRAMNPKSPDAPTAADHAYTGLVCRKCIQPIAVLLPRDGTTLVMTCPACGFAWIVPGSMKT
jgi:hypothetical protein